jgi:hypothetical protein
MTRRRRGRPYQPYPERRTASLARLLVVLVAIAVVVTLAAAFTFSK